LSRVWVVAGFVVFATGLALAGFAAWLAGNSNPDAADLGRACLTGSAGLAAFGVLISVAGWWRLKRLPEGAE
jgi:hypothetical protein